MLGNERGGTCLRSVASVYRSVGGDLVISHVESFLPEDFVSVPIAPSRGSRANLRGRLSRVVAAAERQDVRRRMTGSMIAQRLA